MAEESSGGSSGSSTLAADGDLTTLWEASTNTNPRITLDFGDTREVATLRLQVRRGCFASVFFCYLVDDLLLRKVPSIPLVYPKPQSLLKV